MVKCSQYTYVMVTGDLNNYRSDRIKYQRTDQEVAQVERVSTTELAGVTVRREVNFLCECTGLSNKKSSNCGADVGHICGSKPP